MTTSRPRQDDRRPHPDARNRRELAELLDQTYDRVYFWTRRRDPPVVTPSLGESEGKGDVAWFTPEEVESLREFFAALDTVQGFTGYRGPRGTGTAARRRRKPGDPPATAPKQRSQP